MNNNTFTNALRALVVLAFLLSAGTASAATSVTLNPSAVSVKNGDTFTVKVYLDSLGEKTYTARVSLRFPPELVQISKWQFADTWIQLPRPGYDTTDNADGLLTKTAGFPTGWSGTRLFGTATFSTKQSALGKLVLGGKVLMLNKNSTNVFSSGNEVSVVVRGADNSVPTKEIALHPEPGSKEAPPLFDVQISPGPGAAKNNSVYYIIAVVLIVLAGIAFYLFRRWKKRKDEDEI